MGKTVKILSVGGSIIIPKTGFDISFLKKFRELILKQVGEGEKFILVIGGGATARSYQAAGREFGGLSDTELDEIGIQTTVLNAHFVRHLFGDLAYGEVVVNPTKKVKTNKSVILAAGWKPGCSTDFDSVLLAKTYGAKELINLSNIDYVYDSDPKENPRAQKIEKIGWKGFRKIVGDKWAPGANVPFDPIAAKEAEKLGLTVKFVRGTDLGEVGEILNGKPHQGTVIA